jgi:mycothiol synthase
MIEPQLTVRHYEPDDYPAMADLANLYNQALGSDHPITAEQLATYFSAPDFDRINDSFLIELDGKIVGVTDLELSAEVERGWADGVVHPDYWHQGIGTRLIHLTEARALARAAAEFAPGQALTIQRSTSDNNQGAIHLFEAQGYQQVRTFYEMEIVLDQPVEAPPLPNSLILRPFDLSEHAQAVYEAHQESFADHWGFKQSTYEEWAHYLLNSPEDFLLWLIAWDGDEVAGICINRAQGQTGFVRNLGVLRNWRKQGLGSALLKQSFALFQTHGYTQAQLGVDAASPTHAGALYERAGMQVKSRSLTYRKALRGTLSVD